MILDFYIYTVDIDQLSPGTDWNEDKWYMVFGSHTVFRKGSHGF